MSTSQQTEQQLRSRYEFLKRVFLNYYKANTGRIRPPTEMQRREFAFLMFRERFMVRHKGFRLMEELLESIVNLVPSDIYYSTAYYERPTLDMERKGWQGADLVFDVDADHIETPCKSTHDMWTCNTCKRVSRGKAPKVCPECKGTKIEERAWMCDECLNAARREVLKLIDILSSDFGIEHDRIHTVFSGHRGYHLHAVSEELRMLNDEARKEVVDYVRAMGIDVEALGFLEYFQRGTRIIQGPDRDAPGWAGRVAREIDHIFSEAPPDELKAYGFVGPQTRTILESRDRPDAASLSRLNIPKFSLQIWKKVLNAAISSAKSKYAIPANVDTVVTTDIHRLIRLPNTLNGKTGFEACPVPIERLKEFDPFDDPVVISGEAKVRVDESPSVRIHDKTYGPYNDDIVQLPLAAAVLFVSKGLAVPVEN